MTTLRASKLDLAILITLVRHVHMHFRKRTLTPLWEEKNMNKIATNLKLLIATMVLVSAVGCGSKSKVEDKNYIPETTMNQQQEYSLGASSSGLGL
jgi:hypothetical protein